MNVRGLGNQLKRKSLFKYFKDKQLDVILIQEVHSNSHLAKMWATEWGNKSYFSSGTTNSRGTAILIRPNSGIVVNNSYTDHDGRYVICNIEMHEIKYAICNIYAPNIDDPSFFSRTFKTVEKISEPNVIIGGDFNIALDPKIDKLNCKNPVVSKSAEFINLYMEEYKMCDIWRNRNEELARYTWFKKGCYSMQASRIDLFLVNQGVATKTKSVTITSATRTDHSLVVLTVNNHNIKRGPGVWKLNSQLLNDTKFCEGMIQTIQKAGNDTIRSTLDPGERWDYIKNKCKAYGMHAAKNSTKMRKDLKNNLFSLKYKLQMEMTAPTKNTNTSNVHEAIEVVNTRIREIENDQVQAAIYRSRYKWATQGQKMSKYFFALEKRNFNNKTIFTVIKNDGSICTEQKEILKEQENFYRKLYAKDCTVKFQLINDNNHKLSKLDNEILCRDITIEELYSTLRTMKTDIVPGSDGLGPDFYIKFFTELKPFLQDLYKFVLNTGKLNASARKGLLTLIPKRNKDTRYIKNLRGLTLLCTDYKLLAKTIAN